MEGKIIEAADVAHDQLIPIVIAMDQEVSIDIQADRMGHPLATESFAGEGTITGQIVPHHHEAIDAGIAAGIVAEVAMTAVGEADRDLLMGVPIAIEALALVEIRTTTYLFLAVPQEMFQMFK